MCVYVCVQDKPDAAQYRRPLGMAVVRVPVALPKFADGAPQKLPPLTLFRPKSDDWKPLFRLLIDAAVVCACVCVFVAAVYARVYDVCVLLWFSVCVYC